MQAFGRKAQHAERHRNVFADTILVVDHERVGARRNEPSGRRRWRALIAAPMRLRRSWAISGFQHERRLACSDLSPRSCKYALRVKADLITSGQCNAHPLNPIQRL
jgi:hypothetical protein